MATEPIADSMLAIEARSLKVSSGFGDGIRTAVDDFLFTVEVFHHRRPKRVGEWYRRLQASVSQVDASAPDAEKQTRQAIDHLNREFIALDVSPRTYVDLMLLWAATLLFAIVVDAFTGEQSILHQCNMNMTGYLQSLCGSIQGHLYGYIAFRYALYGVLIGNALIVSYNRAAKPVDDHQRVLTRPGLNLVIGSVLAYVLARMVAEGTLSFDLLGLKVERTTDQLNNPVFQHSGMLFLIGLSSCMASDVYLRRLVEAARRAASSIIGPKGVES